MTAICAEETDNTSTSTMSVNILEHYKDLEEKRVALATKHQAKAAEIQALIEAKTAQKKDLAAEKKKKEKLKAEVINEGVDVSKLDAKIAELDALINQVDGEVGLLEKKHEERAAIPKSTLSRAELLTSVLRNCHRCEVAMKVNDLDDCWTHLPVTIELDEAGRPIECSVRLGEDNRRTLKILHGNSRFSKGFRPEILKWLPGAETELESNGRDEQPQRESKLYAFLDGTGRVILSRTEFSWYSERKKQTHDYSYGARQETERVECNENFADIAVSLEKRFDESVARENGELDLGNEYEGNRLMQHLRDCVLAQTVQQPPFEPTVEEIPSAEIYRSIKTHWDNLASCPWSGSITGALALLKYYVENGEKARFWVCGFKNHYGFRLRTRDHSWLRGNIYIVPASEQIEKKPCLQILRSNHLREGVSLASLGNMRLVVFE